MALPVHIEAGSMEVRNYGVFTNSVGDTEIVAAVPGKRILVLGYTLDASGGTNTLKWRSGTSDLTGAMDFPTDVPTTIPWSPHGWFITAVGAALNLNASASTAVGGHVLVGITDLGPEGAP